MGVCICVCVCVCVCVQSCPTLCIGAVAYGYVRVCLYTHSCLLFALEQWQMCVCVYMLSRVRHFVPEQ